MPLRLRIAIVVLAAIFIGLAVLLLIGHLQGGGGRGDDSNNSDVTGNTSQGPVSGVVATIG